MADYSLAANMYGMFPNMYTNQIALNDLSGLDMYYPTCLSSDPMLTMNGSIFGSPMYGAMPYMGGGYFTNPQDYYKNYEKYQDFMIDNSVRQQQRLRNADLRLNSPQEGINKQATFLHEKIMHNEQRQIQKAYEAFKESVRNMYGSEADEQEIANRASTLYSQITGTSLTDDIRAHGRGSFTQGFLQTLTFGLADSKTAEENISNITGQPVGNSEKYKKVAGNALGGAVIGGIGAIGLNLLWKGKKPLFKCLTKIPVLAAIGGLIAGVVAFSKN